MKYIMPRDETFTIAASRMLVRILCGRSCLLMAELIDLQHYFVYDVSERVDDAA